MNTKNEVLREHLSSWLKASGNKVKRGEIVDNISNTLKIHKKSVSRAFRRIQLDKAKLKPGREVYYDNYVQAAVSDIWNISGRICAENLHNAIKYNVDNLIKNNHWEHDEWVTHKLKKMSLGTLKNRVGKLMKKYNVGRGISTTRSSALKNIIPIFKGPWDKLALGSGQIDTVAHCGGNISGDYVFSLNYTDVPTYWIMLGAQWGKGEIATVENLNKMRDRSPFPLKFLHPDTGSEFINWHAKKWTEVNGIEYTRSEPGKSNDNMYVEERNGHVIRKHLGYQRYDNREILPPLNEYYLLLETYLNHFVPVRRLISKERVGSKIVKTLEITGKTAYARILERDDIFSENKNKLIKIHESLDLFTLKEKLDKMIILIDNLNKSGNKS